MPKMTAEKEFRYDGELRAPGDTFDVRGRDVRVLEAIGKATKAKAVKKPKAKVEDDMPEKISTYDTKEMRAKD